jgi:hypothetical protein
LASVGEHGRGALCRGTIGGDAVEARGASLRMAAKASSTLACLRPVMVTCAPSAARPLAMANPMPLVEPVTRARRPLS